MNDKIQAIREAAIRANPEIVDLKFGCEFLELSDRWVILENKKPDPAGYDLLAYYPEENKTSHYRSADLKPQLDTVFKVIGRPIRFSDVLLAMGKVAECDGREYAVDHHGWFFPYGETDGEPIVQWNLRTDDLTQQSEEFYNFVYELLK